MACFCNHGGCPECGPSLEGNGSWRFVDGQWEPTPRPTTLTYDPEATNVGLRDKVLTVLFIHELSMDELVRLTQNRYGNVLTMDIKSAVLSLILNGKIELTMKRKLKAIGV